MVIIKQHDERDCGAACLAMIAAHYGLRQPISKYRELTKTDKIGTNLYGLVDGAKQIGFDANALRGDANELMDGIRNGEILFPFIAHILCDGVMMHYVVIFGLKNGKFLIADPAQGKQKMMFEKFFQCWTGYIVTIEKTEKFKKGNCTKGNFSKFFLLLKGQFHKLLGIFVASITIAVIDIMSIFVVQHIIDNVITETIHYETENVQNYEIIYTDDGSDEHIHNSLESIMKIFVFYTENLDLNALFLIIVSLFFLQALIRFVRGYILLLLSKKIDIRLTLSYYNHIVDLPISSISMRQTGEYLSRFSDTATIRQAVSGVMLTLSLDSIIAVGVGYILYLNNKQLFFIVLIMSLLYIGIVIMYRNPVDKSNRQVMENNAKLQSYLKEGIDGMETIKAANANQQVKEVVENSFYQFINSVLRNGLISISQDIIFDVIESIGTIIILWIGLRMVLFGKITVGSLIAFYVLLLYFFQPIKNLLGLQPEIQTALVAADRLNDILDLQSEKWEVNKIPLVKVNDWNFRHIYFRYGNKKLALNDICLSIHRGEKIAIVGESGSGKTTIAKMLLRFYNPEKGKILIDGIEIKDVELASLRQSISYVSQNTFLFSDTIKNNLKFGNNDISDEDIYRACKISQLDLYINELPLRYDTPLEENGMNLSGGQRQRIAIARALLKNPQLLILDEATSNLDSITESSIKNSVFNYNKDLTCIIIAHRLTTTKYCDRIYVMEQGRIVEEGTHDELLNKNGKYTQLWAKQ